MQILCILNISNSVILCKYSGENAKLACGKHKIMLVYG